MGNGVIILNYLSILLLVVEYLKYNPHIPESEKRLNQTVIPGYANYSCSRIGSNKCTLSVSFNFFGAI